MQIPNFLSSRLPGLGNTGAPRLKLGLFFPVAHTTAFWAVPQ